MSLLIPAGLQDAPRTKLSLTSIATGASNSLAAAGSGIVRVPYYVTLIASTAGASYACYNGTAGSQIFKGISIVGAQEFCWWDSPGSMLDNKCLVIETPVGWGQGEFHVYCVVTRGGAPSSPLVQ